MRRFNKSKNIKQANNLLQERAMLNEMLLIEGTASPFNRTSSSENIITYNSNINGKNYVIRMSRESSYNRKYTISFRESGGNYQDRARLDVRHANDVLSTIDAIVTDAVSQYDIEQIEYAGVFDEDIDNNHSGQSLRTKMYNRYFSRRYPPGALTTNRNTTTIDIGIAFPQNNRQIARAERQEEELKRKLNEFKFSIGAALADPINNYNSFSVNGDSSDYTLSYRTSTELETLGSINFTIQNRGGQFNIKFKLGDAEPIETGWVSVSPETIVEKIKDEVTKYREAHRAPIHREPIDMFSGFEKKFIMLNIFKLYDNFSMDNERAVATELLGSLDDVQQYSDNLYIIKFKIDNNYAGKFILAIIKNVETNEYKIIMERGNERITDDVDSFSALISSLKNINLENTF